MAVTSPVICDSGSRITRESLDFFMKNVTGITPVVKVVMLDESGYDHWPLRLIGVNGRELWLSGCTTGYRGEGPGGTVKVLRGVGFPVDEELVAKLSSFVWTRSFTAER